MAAPILLFDVNETLLDMSALNDAFRSTFGEATARQQWFLTLQTLWTTAIVIRRYQRFDQLARAALRMTAERRHVTLTRGDEDAIIQGMTQLPPHADVPDALERLRSSGVRLATLTNGTPAGLRSQLQHARLQSYFDATFSAHEVRQFKPAPAPYLYAAHRLGAVPGSVDLVSVHAWDVAGARAAGLFTIFVARPGHPANPADSPADIVVSDVGALARNIVARRAATRRRS